MTVLVGLCALCIIGRGHSPPTRPNHHSYQHPLRQTIRELVSFKLKPRPEPPRPHPHSHPPPLPLPAHQPHPHPRPFLRSWLTRPLCLSARVDANAPFSFRFGDAPAPTDTETKHDDDDDELQSALLDIGGCCLHVSPWGIFVERISRPPEGTDFKYKYSSK